MDLAFAGYLTAIPLLLLVSSSFFEGTLFKNIISYYSYLMMLIVAHICIIDAEIFKVWGFRIDSSLLKYLKTPKEAIASITGTQIFLLYFFLILFFLVLAGIYFKWVHRKKEIFEVKNLWSRVGNALLLLLFIPPLIVIIRGGFQLAALNQSSVAFSNDQFLNQAAINAPWNLCYSLLENNHNNTNPFRYLPEKEAAARFHRLYSDSAATRIPVLRKGRLNVLLIVWESFTAKSVATLGGMKGITPQFEKLMHEGILFDSVYASGDRSDKGLVAVISGFPAQPITSIMQKTTKAAKLPSLGKSFREKGYHTAFYYGGEPEFANIKTYLLDQKYEKIVSKDDFPKETYNSKWGAHDEVVFERLLDDLKNESGPFFSTLFTLSSHEPFEVPMAPLIPRKDEEALFLNSLHYTDSCLYSFIGKAKNQKWWDSTVIVILADHGHRLPGAVSEHKPGEFKIPMLWLGGALTKKDTILKVLGSQTDLSKTLLNQLSINSTAFTFSQDLLRPPSRPFAYYAFKNGFGFLTDKGRLVFDNVSQTFILKDPGVDEEQIRDGKAYLQFSFQEYLNK